MGYASSVVEEVWRTHADKLTVATALVIFLTSCCARWWVAGTSRVKLPPSPPGSWPIIGHLHLVLGPALHKSLAQLSHKYGPLMSLKLGSRSLVVVSSPEMAKEIFKHHDVTFAHRPYMACMDHLDHMTQGFTFHPSSATWRKLRKIYTAELMSPKRRQHSQRIRAEETRALLKSILVASPGAPVGIYSEVLRMVVDVISRILLGRRFESGSGGLTIEELSSVSNDMQIIEGGIYIRDYIPWLRWLRWLDAPKKDCEVEMRRILTVILNEHRAKRTQPSHVDEDVLDALLSHHENDSISEENIRTMLWESFEAGVETTVSFIEWTMASIVKEPRILEKLQTEIDNEVGRDQLVTEGDIPRLHYLQAVVKEAFRLYPPIPLALPHYSHEPCTVAGYYIPAFTTVYLNTWAMGSDPGIWERPLEFSPERFLEEPFRAMDPASGQSFELLPFGSGRRMCPGAQLGLATSQVVLASIVQGFHLSAASQEVDMMDTGAGIVTRMATPLQLHMQPRLPLDLY